MLKIPASALLATVALALPASAAAPVFPPASGVGLEPPPGLQPAKGFNGFKGGAASIVITEMPKAAYAQVEASRALFASRFGAKNADDVEIGGARGFEVKGSQAVGPTRFRKWIVVLDGADETAVVTAQAPEGDASMDDKAVEAALKTIAFRPRPGLDAQVAALPFAVGDLAGFRVSGAALGAALILVDGPKDVDPAQTQSHIVVALNAAPPPKDDRAAFAKTQLQNFQAVRTTEVTSAKTFEADGTQWAQVDAKGSEGPSETPVTITYYVRFGGNDSIAVVCVAPRDAAAKEAPRFKTVALSVKPKG